jgi:hypothetical protein
MQISKGEAMSRRHYNAGKQAGGAIITEANGGELVAL